eukprot:283195-Pyramimonas_sp.AAC.1
MVRVHTKPVGTITLAIAFFIVFKTSLGPLGTPVAAQRGATHRPPMPRKKGGGVLFRLLAVISA